MFTRWSSPEAVFQMLKEISQEMPNDITGIHDYRMLEECGGIQWPLSQAEAFDYQSAGAETPIPSERRLFEDGHFFTADKKARFIFENPREAPELPDEDYPFVLLTGRGTSRNGIPTREPQNQTCCGSFIPKSVMLRSIPRTPKGFRSRDTLSLAYLPGVPRFVRERL